VSGLYLVIQKNRTLLFADATVNVHPDASDLAEIAVLAGEMAAFSIWPRVAMLSYSNFGSVRNEDTRGSPVPLPWCAKKPEPGGGR
jgi:malate dehydrogenase (oxaloacetate-decarboxylating)(NADP+)